MILADSLVNGFIGSNLMGQAIVAVQHKKKLLLKI